MEPRIVLLKQSECKLRHRPPFLLSSSANQVYILIYNIAWHYFHNHCKERQLSMMINSLKLFSIIFETHELLITYVHKMA